jgi:ribosomal 30S subunit maturation factor RimM
MIYCFQIFGMTARNAAAHILGQPKGYFQYKNNDLLSIGSNTYVGNWIVPGV